MLEWPRRTRADAELFRVLADEFASGVVDRGDVVGIEGMPYPMQVGGDAKRDPERVAITEGQVLRHHCARQHRSAHDVQPRHEPEHRADDYPTLGRQRTANGPGQKR